MPPKPPKEGVNQVPLKWTSYIAIFISLQSGLPMDLINTPISSVSCLNLDRHCTSFKKTSVKQVCEMICRILQSLINIPFQHIPLDSLSHWSSKKVRTVFLKAFQNLLHTVDLAVDLEVKFLFTVVKTNTEVADLKSITVLKVKFCYLGQF